MQITKNLEFRQREVGEQFELAPGRNWGDAINDDLAKIDEVLAYYCSIPMLQAIRKGLDSRKLEVF